MSEVKNGTAKDEAFLLDMESALRQIIKNRKSSKADRLSAINAGLKLTAIRHKITAGDPEEGFFK